MNTGAPDSEVLVAPHVSEKSTRARGSANQVVFKVRRDASKPEIARRSK